MTFAQIIHVFGRLGRLGRLATAPATQENFRHTSAAW